MSDEERESGGSDEDFAEHLEEIPDGAGCVEIWDRLSEGREAANE